MAIKFKVSLAEWMIANLGKDAIEKYWSGKNEISPWDISYGSKNKVWIKCQKKHYHEEYKVMACDFVFGNRCSYCGNHNVHPKDSFAQWCIDNVDENFIEKYWSDRNALSPWEISDRSNKEIWVNCVDKEYHGDYKTTAKIFNRGDRCSYCRGFKVHHEDSLGSVYPESLKVWSKLNEKSPFEYTPKSNKKVWWKCENGVHDDYNRRIDGSQKAEFRCFDCTRERYESHLQEKVRLFLERLNYKINHERDTVLKCINPVTNIQLRYDNEVLIDESKLIIEVHGSQHYEAKGFSEISAKKNSTTPEFELSYLQWKDKYKMNYALSQGYHYLEIPYWTDNEQEEWKFLIINKLNEIHSQKS